MSSVVFSSASMPVESNDVYIVSYARTPMGSFQGCLSNYTACELGGEAIKAAIQKAGLTGKEAIIDEVIMGNVLSAGLGQSPATIAARLGGIPSSVPATIVNKVCSSGMKAIMMAANSIKAGQADILVAGGMESMSRVPYLLPVAARTGGLRFGDQPLIDCLRVDGLTDAMTGTNMGLCGEKCATDNDITREASDKYAQASYEKALKARDNGCFASEIIPLANKLGKEKSKSLPLAQITSDEGLDNYNPGKMLTLRSSFKENGTITAANASAMNDGAAALIICSGKFVQKHQLPVLAKIIGWADAAQEGIDFTTTPSLAIPKALALAGLDIKDINVFEINEAFSAVALANIKILGLNPEIVNIWGGAVALGHPLGCSGARVTGTLSLIMKEKNAKYGIAAVCNGGGGASAMVLENVQ